MHILWIETVSFFQYLEKNSKKGKVGVLSICGDCAPHFEKKLAEKDALLSMLQSQVPLYQLFITISVSQHR